LRSLVVIVSAWAIAGSGWVQARAEDSCAECGQPAFPEAAAFLASQGYPQGDYTLLLTWVEAARTPERQFVQGYHILRAGHTEPFDLYSDSRGNLLDADALAALGIPPKAWDLRPVEKQAEIPKSLAETLPPRPKPLSIAAELAPPDLLQLTPIALHEILLEDETGASTPAKGVTRIGVFQEFPQPIEVRGHSATLGAWQTLPDGGALWAVSIYSPEARGQRVHFQQLSLLKGAQAVVYNAFEPLEAYGPYQGIPTGDPDLWSATCFSELVTVECHVPAGADPGVVHLVIDRIAHIYRGFETLPWKAAGWCNNDVTCYPDWATTALGVAGIGTIGQTGTLWCTGLLIADTDPDTDIPYFLAANHCISGQEGSHGASNCEFYWLYQTHSCDGTPPNPADVPRTSQADFLVGTSEDTGTDFSLLRLRNAPPAGLTYIGWTSATPSIGTDVTCIHHPSGDFKRISFGRLTNDEDACMASPPTSERFHQVLWYDGTTEGGSSGSPLLLDDTRQVIGQLYGGYASCSTPHCPDYYGRFDVTFPLLQAYLHPFSGPPTVDFSATEFSVSEGDAEAIVTVILSHGPGTAPASVDYATLDASAEAGRDYTATSGTLTFLETEFSKTFSVPVIHDTTHEWNETVVLTLSEAQGCTLAGTHNPATLRILDNDPDTDGDSLSDYDETHGTFGYVTDPTRADTDGDGVDDWTEIYWGYDPTNGAEFPRLGSIKVPFFR